MGHNSHAGLTANLAVAACRNQRRHGGDLVTTGERVEETLIDHFGHDTYVTAILADVNARTGLFSWINRGHHPPDPRRPMDDESPLSAGSPAGHRPGSVCAFVPRAAGARRPDPAVHRRRHRDS
ncbi:SpoIIE family protein phosphatase [Streptomyces solaniscabiei]|uniref:SpoIIE family protein phosphatase n=1 Tax=Streptomyces solaniscabiei TaxID=2683255 RepID=UPI00226B8BF0|nr:SpoIIE family protein phosphatase [Streptomyces solaniscabiei]